MSTTTSVCARTETACSPTVFSGPLGRRTCDLATVKPFLPRASAMSALVTEPNRRPSTPAFCVMRMTLPASFSPTALRGGELVGGGLLEIGALGLEFLDRVLGGAARQAGRDQEVARVAVLDLDDVAQVAEVGHLFQQDDLHGVVTPQTCVDRCTAAARGSARA
jgi:hypothetical protein